MTIDRYAKAVLTVIALALCAIAAREWLPAAAPRGAEAQTTVPRYEVAVPKSWGKIVSFSNNNLLMEAPDGTLRVVDVEGRAPEYPRVKVHIRWQ